jgi:hypothetical protein
VFVSIDWTWLPEPRRLTAAEQAVVDRLVAHVACTGLTAQAASAWVTAVCGCGCRSVRLRSDAAPLSGAEMTRLSSTGRDDWFSIDYTRADQGMSPDRPTGEARLFQVVVHVVAGSLHELEIFVAEGVAVDIPGPDELTEITVA